MVGSYASLCFCLGLWNLRCALLHWYRAKLCTIDLSSAHFFIYIISYHLDGAQCNGAQTFRPQTWVAILTFDLGSCHYLRVGGWCYKGGGAKIWVQANWGGQKFNFSASKLSRGQNFSAQTFESHPDATVKHPKNLRCGYCGGCFSMHTYQDSCQHIN